MIHVQVVLDLYDSGMNQQQVANFIGCHVNSIRRLMRESGATVRPVTRQYALDEVFFDHIDTPEKAYWLGFLLADGTIKRHARYGTTHSLVLGLASIDSPHIESFRSTIHFSGPNKKIHYYDKRYDKWYDRSQVTVTSRYLCDRLVSMGWDDFKKRGDVTVLDSVHDSLRVHLLRGLVDGDGCIALNMKEQRAMPLFHFTDLHESVVHWVFQSLSSTLGLQMPIIKENGNGTKRGFNARWCDISSVKKVTSYLYDSGPWLHRKKSISDRLKAFVPVTRQEIGLNCGHALRIEIEGQFDTISGWCRRFGLGRSTFNSRVEGGMDQIQALTSRKRVNQFTYPPVS